MIAWIWLGGVIVVLGGLVALWPPRQRVRAFDVILEQAEIGFGIVPAEEIDRHTLAAGIAMLREIYAQPSFRDLWSAEVLPGKDATGERALADFARAAGGTVFHCVGSCRMGTDARSVVDPELRVRAFSVFVQGMEDEGEG
jgi:choline dehydrogenase